MSCCSAPRSSVSEDLIDNGHPELARHRLLSQPALLLSASALGTDGDASEGDKVVRLAGDTFWMGSEDEDVNPGDGEGPVREVSVGAFAISRFTVTNRDFARFVNESGYVSEAEEFGWSYVFAAFLPGPLRARAPRPEGVPWWCGVADAYWAAPQGPGSSVTDVLDHPVVHVSWRDAEAYAAWAGGRLPTEVEWEYAARGGLDRARYPWGDALTPSGEHRCNIWQGRFPARNTVEDGYRGTAPVDAYLPNGYGLHNVAGNVWEMCADAWATGPEAAPADPTWRVMRGGSYLCHDSYCNRYRVAARTSNTVDSSSGNQGFRIAFEH